MEGRGTTNVYILYSLQDWVVLPSCHSFQPLQHTMRRERVIVLSRERTFISHLPKLVKGERHDCGIIDCDSVPAQPVGLPLMDHQAVWKRENFRCRAGGTSKHFTALYIHSPWQAADGRSWLYDSPLLHLNFRVPSSQAPEVVHLQQWAFHEVILLWGEWCSSKLLLGGGRGQGRAAQDREEGTWQKPVPILK